MKGGTRNGLLCTAIRPPVCAWCFECVVFGTERLRIESIENKSNNYFKFMVLIRQVNPHANDIRFMLRFCVRYICGRAVLGVSGRGFFRLHEWCLRCCWFDDTWRYP